MVRLKLWAGAALAGLLALLGIIGAVTRAAGQKGRIRALRGYADTRKAMDDVDDQIVGDDPAAARVFLEDRAKR